MPNEITLPALRATFPQGKDFVREPAHWAHQIAQLAAPIRPSSITSA